MAPDRVRRAARDGSRTVAMPTPPAQRKPLQRKRLMIDLTLAVRYSCP